MKDVCKDGGNGVDKDVGEDGDGGEGSDYDGDKSGEDSGKVGWLILRCLRVCHQWTDGQTDWHWGL